MALFFVLVQSKVIAQTNLRSQMLDQLSSTDILTGLKNRRGYEQILSELSGDESIGAVFCDLNSLKEVNDNFGHEAGDRLIQRFAGILKEYFPEDHVYRISGDEFVVLIRNADAGQFPEQMQMFADTLRKNDRIAAFGFEVGAESQALQVIKSAEQMMYRDKDAYYLETGKHRRHSSDERELRGCLSGRGQIAPEHSTDFKKSGCRTESGRLPMTGRPGR